jgi:superfamily I DNA/RNA helicase
MIEIQVAGAGAGKTYGLAEAIIGCLDNVSHKKIYALTYTNAAKEKIELEIIKKLKAVPDRVEIETIHTFLLNEIIYPFSPFVIGEQYNTASTMRLNPKYKTTQIKRLKTEKIMHVEEAYAAARRVVDKDYSGNKTKAKKARVDRILNILSACIEKIFLDEVQDLDETALRAFEILGLNAVDIYMVGDPKQAIKYSGEFTKFIRKYQKTPNPLVKIHPHNNVTRRVPTEILSISNKFCYPGQEQTSISRATGFLKYIESTHHQFDAFINRHVNEGSLVCIESKIGSYSTKKYSQSDFHHEIKKLLIESCLDKDPYIFLAASEMIFHAEVSRIGLKPTIYAFLKRHGISYSKKIYAQIAETASDEQKEKFHISSIDAVKGLEADFCVLILTPNTYKYLTHSGLNSTQRFNKEWKKIYVALTRPKKEFIVVIDHELFIGKDISVDDVRKGLLAAGFSAL